MRSLRFAWLSLVRQPGRTLLGVLGVAATGALLFDMLLLANGLVVAMEDLLDDAGFDVRVTAMDGIPFGGPRLRDASTAVTAITVLPEVARAVPMRLGDATVDGPDDPGDPDGAVGPEGAERGVTVIGAPAGANAGWTLVEGRRLDDVEAESVRPVLVNSAFAEAGGLSPGGDVTLRGDCGGGRAAAPAIAFRVNGIAAFSFDSASELTAAMSLADLADLCGDVDPDEAEMILVTSRAVAGAGATAGADAAARAIRQRLPEVFVATNAELVDRFQQQGNDYFRQISSVLASVTLFFALLLVTTLLTVSVNQRLAEVATLRALGFSRRRIATDLLAESVAIVGAGGLLALPLGAALAVWLDGILRSMPGMPAGLHFFVFQPRALVLHLGLLAATAVLAALYPMHLATRLPIAATLREEVVS
ncbi:MAG: FtsX-like permease family protein [Acidobacteria bacterium]|nr:FtsX-like permease family protein [Acidobacteriota bacterium]